MVMPVDLFPRQQFGKSRRDEFLLGGGQIGNQYVEIAIGAQRAFGIEVRDLRPLQHDHRLLQDIDDFLQQWRGGHRGISGAQRQALDIGRNAFAPLPHTPRGNWPQPMNAERARIRSSGDDAVERGPKVVHGA